MEKFKLDLESPIKGVYLSSEMIDLMSIIQCKDLQQLSDFVMNCEQMTISLEDRNSWREEDIEAIKHKIFKEYQDSFISLEEQVTDSRASFAQALRHIGIEENIMEELFNVYKENGARGIKETLSSKYPEKYEKMAKSQHRFIASERDQIKRVTYDEIATLIGTLQEHNTILLGGGRYYDVVNKMVNSQEDRYDFYQMQRGLDFCERNGLSARYHTLLDKQTLDGQLAGKNKEEVLAEIEKFVRQSIDFINEYNANHVIKDENGNTRGLITSIDLFNEIISFDKVNENGERDENGEYRNMWQLKYGITLEELMQTFSYALENKPEGVTYVYNEPFLENLERRNAVISLIKQMKSISPNLIDTLGTQMHIETNQNMQEVEQCFKDFYKLQEEFGLGIQITEFDMCLPEAELFAEDGSVKDISDDKKKMKIAELIKIISDSGVDLEGVSYWSISDTLDHNVQRTNTKTFLAKDFYSKFKELTSESSEMSLEQLLKHPFLSKGQVGKFKELYYQEGGKEKLEQIIQSRQREVIESRLSGLYSGISRDRKTQEFEQSDILASAVEATETVRTGTINEQGQTIRSIQRDKTQQQDKMNNGINK